MLTILLEIERVLNNSPITYDYPTDLDNSQRETFSQVTYQNILLLYLTTFGTDGELNI